MKMRLKKNWKTPLQKKIWRKSENKKKTQKKHPALIDENQELDEMELEIDHLFSEYDKKIKSKTDIDLDDETPNNSDQVSSWA